MKKLFTSFFILISFSSFSQTDIGIKLGANYTIPSSDLKDLYGNGQVRFHAGFFTREDKGKVNVLFEAFYKNTSFKKSGYKLDVHSFNFPILIETSTFEDFGLHAGVSPTLNLSTKTKGLIESNFEMKPFNIDLALGFEVRPVDKLGINARFNYPLLNSSSVDGWTLKYSTIMLSVNYVLASFE